ncbi:unnamed protein product, partial [Heterosigma akashiwo]
MEPSEVIFSRDDYIKTSTSNYVSKKAKVFGAQYVTLKGQSIVEPNVTIRGDLAPVKIDRYCFLAESSVIRPSYTVLPEKCSYMPIQIGSGVHIGENSIVQAGQIGSNVYIGKNCIIDMRCFIRDNCVIEDGAVLAPGTLVPPFSVVAGCPGKVVGELPESAAATLAARARAGFRSFR